MNCLTGEMILRSYKSANTSSTIEFVKELQSQDPEAKIVLIWDGASHHRSQEFRDFLAQTNQGEEWNVHCLRFAPQRGRADRRKTTGKLKACAHLKKILSKTFGDS